MTTIAMKELARTYKNNGQHAEQVFRFTLTNTIAKADNIAHDKGTDCLDFQIKTARATVCKGTDIERYLENDKANRFAYVESTFKTAYIMTKTEYIEFVKLFGTVTTESEKNGGGTKIRLKHETKEMIDYLNR